MKRVIIELILFVLSITFFGIIYIGMFKISFNVFFIFSIIVVSYVFCMAVEDKSVRKLKKYEKKIIKFQLTKKECSNILLYSLTALTPTYFCVVLVSLIPMYTYEVWFITVFPCILLNCLPASVVLDEYHHLVHKKFPFLAIFILITILFCFIGIVVSCFIFG